MQRVPIHLVKPGMILARPVINEKGMPLCAEGTELNATIIDRLKKMGIDMLTLKGHPVDLGRDEKTSEEKVREMMARFGRVTGEPVMDKLKEAIAAAMTADDLEEEEPQGEHP